MVYPFASSFTPPTGLCRTLKTAQPYSTKFLLSWFLIESTPDTILAAYGKIWSYKQHKLLGCELPYATTDSHLFEEIPHQQMFSGKHALEVSQKDTLKVEPIQLNIPDVDKIPKSIKLELPPVQHTFPSLEPLLKSLSSAVDKVKQDFAGHAQQFDYVRMIELVIATCSAIWALIESQTLTQSLSIITLYVSGLGLASHIADALAGFYAILTQLRDDFTPEQQTKQKQDLPQDNVFWSIIRIIRSMFSWQTEKEIEVSHHQLKRFITYSSFLKKTKDFFTYIFTMMREAFEYLYEWKYGVPWAPKETQELCVKINEFTQRVLKMTKYYSETRKESTLDISRFYEVQNLLFTGEAIAEEVTLLEGFKHNVTHFHAAITSLNTLYTELKQDKRISNGKVPSFNTWLTGQPGVGKSTLLALVPAFHAAVEGTAFNAHWMWVRTLGEAFWSGYRGQRFAFFDDITAVADPEKASQNFFEFINASGEIPYSVPMPDIGSKGSTYFTSEDIMLTSMNDHIPSHKEMGLSNRAAICRRIDLFIEVRVKGQTKDQIAVVDYGKPLDVNRYEFRIGDPFAELEPFKNSKIYDFVDLMGEYFTRKILKRGGATSAITALVNYPEILAPVKREFMTRWGGRIAEAQMQVEEINNTYLATLAQEKEKEELENQKIANTLHEKKEPLTPMEGGSNHKTIPKQQCNEDNCPHFKKRSDCKDLSDEEYLTLNSLLTRSGDLYTFRACDIKKSFHEIVKDLKEDIQKTQKQNQDYLLKIVRASKTKTIIHYIIDALIIASGVVGLIHLLKGPSPIQQSLGHYLKWRQLPSKAKLPQQAPQIVPLPQSNEIPHQQMSETYLSLCENVLGPNTATLSTHSKSGKVKQTQATFVGAHMFYCPGHFFTLTYAGGPVEFETSKGTFVVSRDKLKLSHMVEQDICFGVIEDPTVPNFKSILHHFITEQDTLMEMGSNLMLVTRTPKNSILTMMMTNAKRQDEQIVRNLLGEIVTCQRVVGGKIPTSVGDCGASYIIVNDQWVHKIAAMHIMGTGVKGWGSLLTQETLRRAFGDLLPAPTQQSLEVRILPYVRETAQTQLPEDIKDNITIIGTVDPPYHIPTKNPIVPSPLCGLFIEPKEHPTILNTMYRSDGTKVDPAVQMFKKLNRSSQCNANIGMLDEIARIMVEKYPNEFEYRVLDDFEILNGVRGRAELKPVVISASPGYPFNTQHLGKGKTPFIFRDADGFLHYEPEFKKYFDNWRWRLEHDYEKLSQEPESVAFCYFLKQERVDPRKIWEYREPTEEELQTLHKRFLKKYKKEDETRVLVREPFLDLRGIAAAHLCVFLTMRQLFGALVINRFTGQEEDHCKIGINPHSYDWHRLYVQAVTYGPDRLRFGDCKKYDASVKSEVSSRVWNSYNEKYKQHYTYEERHGLLRQRLHDLVHKGLLILREILFKTKGGNQSGQLLTTVENGDTLFMELVYCIWDYCLENRIPITIREIIDILILADFGDDDWFTLPEFLDGFTTIEFAQRLKKWFDMDYVSADKYSPLKPLYNIREVTFLCRIFDPFPEWCFAPTELDVIDDSLNWCDPSKVGMQKAMESNAETACYEYWHHKEEIFADRQRRLNEAMKELGWKQFNKTWDEILDERMSGLTNPQLRQYAVPDISIQQSKIDDEEHVALLQELVNHLKPKAEVAAGKDDLTKKQKEEIIEEALEFTTQKYKENPQLNNMKTTLRHGIAMMWLMITYPTFKELPNVAQQVKWASQECIKKFGIDFGSDPVMWALAYKQIQTQMNKESLEATIEEFKQKLQMIEFVGIEIFLDTMIKQEIPHQQSCELTETHQHPSAIYQENRFQQQCRVLDHITRSDIAVQTTWSIWNPYPTRQDTPYTKLLESTPCLTIMKDWAKCTFDEDLDIPQQQSKEVPFLTIGNTKWVLESEVSGTATDMTTFETMVNDYINRKKMAAGTSEKRKAQTYKKLKERLEEVRDFADAHGITYQNKQHPELDNVPKQQSKEFKFECEWGDFDEFCFATMEIEQAIMDYENSGSTPESAQEVRNLLKDHDISFFNVLHPEFNTEIPHQQSKEEATVPSNIASAPAPQPMDTTNKQENQTVTSPSATQATITGTFGDNTAHEMPAMTQTTPIVTPGSADDPYDDQGIGIVISREYEVDTITWSYGDPTGTFLWSGFFPDLLLDIPNIVEKLDRFQYLRAGVRVTFRINGVILHFGCLQITVCPHFNASSNVDRYFQTIYTASNLGPHFLSPNTNTTVDVLIPFVTPSRFQNLVDSAAEPGFIGIVAAHVLAPLTLEGASSVPELKISVFAHFEIPKAAGLGLRLDVMREKKIYLKLKGMIKKRQDEKKGKHLEAEDDDDFEFIKKVIPHQQSKEQDTKSEKKTQSSKYAGHAKQKTESIVRPIAAEATEILGFLSEIKGALMDKPTDVQGVTKVRIDPQSGLALADGLDHAEPLSLVPENKVAYDTSMFGQDRDYNLFVNYKMLPSLVYIGQWTGSQAKGTKLLTLPINPAFVNKYQQVIGPDTYNYFDVTNLGNLVQYFRWWRGGIKILIKIFASKFTSGRVVLKWLPDPTYSGSIANEEFGDTVFHMIDVTGDTDYCHTVPWLRERAWEVVNEFLDVEYGNITSWSGTNGQDVMEVSNALTISNASASPIVYFAVYWSGAEDFDVARPREPMYDDGSINAVEAKQCKHRRKRVPHQQSADIDITKTTDAKLLFRSVFPSMVPARLTAEKHVTMGETVESWTQLFRRYTIVKRDVLSTASSYSTDFEPYTDTLNQIQPLQRALRAFHYKRGSFRIKALCHFTSAVVEMRARNFYQSISDLDDWGMPGVTWTVTSIRPWIEFQIPFYFQYDMVCNSFYSKEHSTLPAAMITLNNYVSSTTNFACELLWYGSLGDDFSLGWPASPVPLRQIVPLKMKKTT